MIHSTMRTALWALACTTTLLAHAQTDQQMLKRHFGGTVSGEPPMAKWVPQKEEGHRLGYQPGQSILTKVDTTLHKGEDMCIVFFRTRNTYNEGVFHPGGGNMDHISAAVYGYDVTSETGELKLDHFEKWLLDQNTNDSTPKARLLEAIDGAPVFVIASDYGEMLTPEIYVVHHEDHFFSIPDLKPILMIRTKGADYGSDNELDVQREWRILRPDDDWKEYPDIEVKTKYYGEKAWKTSLRVFDEARHKYVEKAAPPPDQQHRGVRK